MPTAAAHDLRRASGDADSELAAQRLEPRHERIGERDAPDPPLSLGALLWVARDEDLLEARRGRNRAQLLEQPRQNRREALAADRALRIEREVEVPEPLRTVEVVEQPGHPVRDAGARQHAGEDLDHQRESVALVAAERDDRVELARVRDRGARLVDRPALGDRPALVAGVED